MTPTGRDRRPGLQNAQAMPRPRLRKLDYQEFPPPRFHTPLPGPEDWKLWRAVGALYELRGFELPASRWLPAQLSRQAEALAGEPYLAMELEVAGPAPVDLKTLLAPLARGLPLRLATVRRTDNPENVLRISQAERAAPPQHGQHRSCLRTWGPAASRWREDLRQKLVESQVEPLLEGQVGLQLSWRCSSLQNWVELWRPTGDSLGPVLGERRPMRPRLERVSQMSLHLSLDDRLGMAVDVGYWWSLVG